MKKPKTRFMKTLYPLLKIIAISVFPILFFYSCQNNPNPEITKKQNDFKFLEKDIAYFQSAYKNGDLSVEEVTQEFLNRIKSIDQSGPQLNSIIYINPKALEVAQLLDTELKNGIIRGPLHGIPVVLKDNIDTYDMPTTAGSRALKGSYPSDDSDLAKKLRAAGAVILGKANLSEWANFRGEMSTSGWSGLGGQTKNPYDLSRNPCGSSSGSGVAVSANLSVLAIGTETNGSVVCPSAINGIVGIKPTVGLVSRDGVIPISFTQDTPGPMARSVTDAAICLGALTGIDSSDSKTLESEEHYLLDYTSFLKKDGLKGKKLGFLTSYNGIHYKVDELMQETIEFLKEQGVEIIEIDKIYEPNVSNLSFAVMLQEYGDGLNQYFASLGENAKIKSLEELIEFNRNDSVELMHFNQKYLEMALEKEGMNSDVYKETLAKMLKGAREEGMDRVMNEYNLDAIIAPTTGPAWKTDYTNGDSYHFGSSSPAAISGYPNITVPMGFIDGLPIGISFFGKAWSEGPLIEIAYTFEQASLVRKAPVLD